ncbi:MAG: MBL fold metallo-hydrolase [Candidatus Kariarchaeaceae archaeon]
MSQLQDLNIIPLAGESLGTRSMAVAVQGEETQVILDPGVDIAPNRFNLPPHQLERERRKEHRENILNIMKDKPVAGFWVSHYHHDHFPKINEAVKINEKMKLWEPRLHEFPKSDFFIKHPKEDLNKNQTRRARKFVAMLRKLKQNFLPAENLEIKTEEFTIKGSPLLPHGEISLLGYVVGCSLTYKDTKLCFTGDIVGAPLKEHSNWIIHEQPDILIMDGPMKEQLKQFKENLPNIIDQTNIKHLIIEHHLLRSKDWEILIADEIDYSKSVGLKIYSYAELLGKKVELLEVNRAQLYEYLPESAPIHTKPHKRKKSIK